MSLFLLFHLFQGKVPFWVNPFEQNTSPG